MDWENRRPSCNIEDRRGGLDAVNPVREFFNKLACELKNDIAYDENGMARDNLVANTLHGGIRGDSGFMEGENPNAIAVAKVPDISSSSP